MRTDKRDLKQHLSEHILQVLHDMPWGLRAEGYDVEAVWVEIGGDETADVTQAMVEAKLEELVAAGEVEKTLRGYGPVDKEE